MEKGDVCVYKVKGICGAPSFKLSDGYQNDFSVQYLEFNDKDFSANVTQEYNSQLRESWPSSYPLKKIVSPRDGEPVRNQVFYNQESINIMNNINNQTNFVITKRPIKGLYDLQ